jgi:hypothetical protein
VILGAVHFILGTTFITLDVFRASPARDRQLE